jgi:hypothetical protein
MVCRTFAIAFGMGDGARANVAGPMSGIGKITRKRGARKRRIAPQ